MGKLCLTRLDLSHFRSWRQGSIRADGRPVALWGPNGAGKTNVLEAVSMFSPGRGLRRALAEELSRRPEGYGWRLSGILRSLHQVHEVEMRAEPGQSRALRIDDKAAAQVALGRVARVLWLVPSMDRLWTEAAEGRRRFLDRMVLSIVPGHAEATLVYEKAMRERNRLLRDEQRDQHWYLALERQMAEAGSEIQSNRLKALQLIAEATEEAETAFPAPALSLSHAEGELPAGEADLRTALAEGRRRDMAAGRTLTGPHRVDLEAFWSAKGIAARDASTGEQKALLVSLILANARGLARDFGAPPILLLDEVAAHLDAGRRAALYDEICALGAQAWMTGTGPELFTGLGERAQYLEVTEEAGESRAEERTAP
ncbi:DNA replication/repair protein RecF [Pseudooceanicola sp. CBS1P-1]|uniref:DNA replication and repair protein RecF n=1 Tax=Pseudooceanicola albus TaxID=2692189 RepID=A0A6L7G727_9RHOB|nr:MULTISPECIES: DNA replication/repair protein RecF [Pseudooceanicola]MBT9385833.1 DNA replication/repair protein RecF [Pseudooceanicola endophyticus]MXN20064.1 DNA replication/repair protein RecF [Pseudooceanicola albus]